MCASGFSSHSSDRHPKTRRFFTALMRGLGHLIIAKRANPLDPKLAKLVCVPHAVRLSFRSSVADVQASVVPRTRKSLICRPN